MNDVIKKQNILIVHNYYQIPGGEDTVVANEMQMLNAYGHKVILYSRYNSELKSISRMKKLMLPVTTVFNPRTYREIKKLIKKERIEIVHVHNTLNLISPSVYYAALKCRVPVVQTVHNFRLLCPGATFYRDGHICEDCVEKGLGCAVKHSCYRGSKLHTLACVINTKFHRMTGIYGKINYICLTEFNKEKLSQLKQIKEEQIFVKPNFVENIGEFVPEEERENQFVFAGRLDKLKGIDILLKAWKQMGTEAPKLIICGTGPMEEWCKKFVEENHINAELRGFLMNEDVRRLLAKSRALILPTQLYEGFPMCIAEAYSVRTPVICSNLGNTGALVCDKVSGIKIKYDSVEELENAVAYIESAPFTVPEKVWRKYSVTENYKTLLEIYGNIAK